MSSLLSLPKFGSSSSSQASSPKKIQNQFYKNLREFTAWNAWGTRPDHTKKNDKYIPITGAFVKQYDYPAALQKLIDFGWKAATKPTGPRAAGFVMGGQRAAGPIDLSQKGAPSLLRKGFQRPMRNNWSHITKFEQVAAYSFRGDTRPPELIQAAGGYFPPSTRTDDFYTTAIAHQFYNYMTLREGLNLDPQAKASFVREVEGFIRNQGNVEDRKLFGEYHFWRTILEKEEMHLAGMTNDSFLKAYISTTRDIDIAKAGSTGMLGGAGVQQTSFGWIYVLRVKSGFLLKPGVGGVSKEEGEIAHLGPILWQDVMGFVSCAPNEKTVYLRNMFDQQDYQAFKLVLASLSAV